MGLGSPFWVSGRIMPTRTGPAPSVWPTVGPAAAPAERLGAADVAGPGASPGPRRVAAAKRQNRAAAPISARRARPPALRDTDTSVIMDLSRPARRSRELPSAGTRAFAGVARRPGPPPLFAAIVAFSPARMLWKSREADEARNDAA